MPKFFGPDTVLWYYPEKPASGYVFYVIALFALGVGIWPFVKSPGKILRAMRGDLADGRQKSDFDMVVLTAASFVPYLSQAPGVPSYFFGACFFLSMLTGRMLERWLFFLDSIAAPRRGRCARRDPGNGNFCSHSRWTNKRDRNTLSVRGPEDVLHDTNCLSGYRWG